VPSAGVASLQKPPFTDDEAPDSVATTVSAISASPASRSASRTSSAMPLLAAILYTLAAVVNGGL
jgi:hypothetical protein